MSNAPNDPQDENPLDEQNVEIEIPKIVVDILAKKIMEYSKKKETQS
ncbi:MAG: hypothetical protein PWR06_845 [Thermoanaerobacteraceae bacterium]|jgi:hypothetical protein|nr:hypothetical protein [Thermoanaerobacteraceae bacterium]